MNTEVPAIQRELCEPGTGSIDLFLVEKQRKWAGIGEGAECVLIQLDWQTLTSALDELAV